MAARKVARRLLLPVAAVKSVVGSALSDLPTRPGRIAKRAMPWRYEIDREKLSLVMRLWTAGFPGRWPGKPDMS